MSASQLLTKEEQEALGVRPTGTTPGAGNPAPTRRQSSPSIPARVVSGVLASRRGGRKTFTWGDNQENVQRTVIQNTPLAGRNTSGSTKVARAIANYVPQRDWRSGHANAVCNNLIPNFPAARNGGKAS
eukprot:gene16629-16627_t